MDATIIQKKRDEFAKDLEARRSYIKRCNFHYLMYKGISLLNQQYSKDVLESLGLQIFVPRTFMTIETIRPDLDRPIDISAKWRNHKERDQAVKVQQMLKGEWGRAHGDNERAKSEFDGLVYGTGKLLSYFELDEEKTEIFEKYDKEGRPVYKIGKQVNYEGMKVKWLNPYYSIPDRKARTYEHGRHDSRRREWVVAIWDWDEWLAECKKKGYKTSGMVKGGFVEELDSVKRTIDAIYNKSITNHTRDNGKKVSESPTDEAKVVDENSIGVITEYTAREVNIYAGENWTVVHQGKNQNPKKEIPIYALKDIDVPGELEGIGEAEILRWQQYEENKLHNLMYLQVILNTVKRYGVIESMLEDPTQMRSSKMLEPIRLKGFPGAKVNDAIQILNQASSSDVPLNVLNEIKSIGQMATGQTDYAIASNKGEAGTLGEAEMMNEAGGKRIKQKIQQMEERGITPILESWLSAIPRLYTEELDYLLNDGTNKDVKFLPFDRKMNTNGKLVAKYAIEVGATTATTVEEVFLSQGYSDVVFVSDLLGGYDISIKTSLAFLDKQNIVRQFQSAIAEARAENAYKISIGQPPTWDTDKLLSELFRQFNDIIDDVDEYKIDNSQLQQTLAPQAGVPAVEIPPPTAKPANLIPATNI